MPAEALSSSQRNIASAFKATPWKFSVFGRDHLVKSISIRVPFQDEILVIVKDILNLN